MGGTTKRKTFYEVESYPGPFRREVVGFEPTSMDYESIALPIKL